TGDFKVRASRTAEAARFARADTLIMETTFGLPRFRFPSTIKVRNAIARFCRACLEEGEVPVLVAYSLGKAQELMAQLGDAGFSWLLHPACFEITSAYVALGVEFPPYAVLDESADPAGKVLLVPPSAARSQAVRRIGARRLAMCTGWALTPGAKFRHQVDEVFPLSDHADYAELLAAVDHVQPSLVLTTHGFASEFACDLRERGLEAWSLGADDQMEFSFGLRGGIGEDRPEDDDVDAAERGETQSLATREAGAESTPVSEFTAFVRIGDVMAATTGRLAKIELLSAYFRDLEDEFCLGMAARFLSGRAVTGREHQKALATGWPIIRLALLHATGISVARLRQLAASQPDASSTACLALMHGQKAAPRPLSLADISHCIDRLLAARGSIAKAAVLETYFRQMTPAEGQYLVKILTGDMRMGLKDGTIEEALAAAFHADPANVRDAHTLTGDLGETARLARRGKLDRARLTLFQPLRPMLASPEPSAKDIWQRLMSDQSITSHSSCSSHPRSIWLEEKLGGIRAQLHKRGPRVEIYSRDLRRLDAEGAEIAGPAALLADDLVLDGIIIGVAQGRQLDPSSLQQRLGRRERDLFLDDDVQVRYVVFDLLYHNGESLLTRPLIERRACLEAVALPLPMQIIERRSSTSASEIDSALVAARSRGSDGLVAKDPLSPYSAGRRSRSWLVIESA
ncbi:MAG: DNA ligase, partial [Verrucomicrobiales bacterium]